MDLYKKISILGPSAQYDTCGPKDFGTTTDIPGVYHAKVGGSRVCRLFKVLQTNECVNSCNYCAFRRDRSTTRAVATSDEMATAFESAYSRRLVDGLFLSSGLDGSPDSTMTRMLDTAHILRDKMSYRGYLHLKIMPRTSSSCISEAIRLASRVSLNIEAPTEEDLTRLSPCKDLRSGFYHTMSLIKDEIRKQKRLGEKVPSITTQFVVGAGEERDRDIINSTSFLYKNFGLSRVFYSAFRPVHGTPLEDMPPASLTREHRLYQVDFLMRFYRFRPKDIPLGSDGNLFDDVDPKTIWAQNHPEFFPVNINTASYWRLLRVPGMGPVTAKKVISQRSSSCIRSIFELHNQRVQINKIEPYICC
ncbi:putative DNA modification/repair radical SAM protein [Candidatus Dojkabacteria bacterium]|nr:putative DNA modification/repair radical SAM protein [Candidatus Dojkabacteria bacterium]